MKRRFMASVLAVAMVLTMLTGLTFAADGGETWDGTADTSWYNETDTEFTISTAEQLAGLAELVSGETTFKGVTITLANDLDLYCEDTTSSANGDPLTFRPIGDNSKDGTFEGIFDGAGYTIYNLYQNGWDLGYEWGTYGSYGLFGNVNNATIKNLTISGAESYIEGGDVGGITGSATGTCVFENITITDSVFATYNNGCGGIIAWSGAGNYTFKNIKIDDSVTLAGLWGSFDSSIGGVVGQAEPGATYNFENVDIACRLDAYNDCTASYDYYNYRMCGMIMGRLEETTTIDGKNYPDTSKYNITCDNVTVVYGDWCNYHYCDPTPGYNGGRGMRVESGYSYDGLPADYDHTQCTNHCKELIPFDQVFGGKQLGVDGLSTYEGVTIKKENIYRNVLVHNGAAAETVKIAIPVGQKSVVVKYSDFEEYAEREGYTFKGWNLVAYDETRDGVDKRIVKKPEDGQYFANDKKLWVKENTEFIVLYADNAPNTIDLRYIGGVNGDYGYTADGDWWEIEKVTNDTTSNLDAYTFERKGYTFAGWRDKDGNDIEAPYVVSDTDDNGVERVWAKWTINQYTITFDTDGGSVIDPITQDYGTEITAPADPTKTGYTFAGWVDEDGNACDVPATMPAEDMTLTATWDANAYTLRYMGNGGKTALNSGNLNEYPKYDETVTLMPNKFIRDGYKFIGWSTTEKGGVEFEDGASFINAAGGANLVRLYAVWEKTHAKVTYIDNCPGATTENLGSELVEFGKEVPLPSTAREDVTEGYELIGWTYGNGLYNAENPLVAPTNDINVYTKYALKEYTVTFVVDGETISMQTVQHGSAAIEPAVESKAGHTFSGWDVAFDNITGDTTVTASWVANGITVNYHINDGTEDTVVTKVGTFGEYKIQSVGFTRGGYALNSWATTADWSYAEDGAAKYLNGMLIEAEDLSENNTVDLYAVWRPNGYKIIYHLNDGSETVSDPEAHTVGDDLGLADPETLGFVNEGHEFAGWAVVAENPSKIYKVGMTADITRGNIEGTRELHLYAIWDVNTYNLTVDLGTGAEDAVTTTTQAFGSEIVLETPVWEGHTFTAWQYTDTVTGETVEVTETMPAYDLTVTAIWDTNVYTVTYLDGFGKTFTVFNVPFGAKVPVAAAPYVPGYDFMGWTPSVPKTMPASNLTFTAQWQRSMCKVTINQSGDGIVSSNVNLNAVPSGSYVTLTLTPTGYSAYVSVNGEQVQGNTYTLYVTDDMTIDVVFSKEGFIWADHGTSATQSWYEKALEIYANSLK